MHVEIRDRNWQFDQSRPGHPGDVDNPARPVLPYAIDYLGSCHRPRHHHRRGQLVYAVSGVMEVTTDAGTWIVAPQHAVWVPPLVDHEVGHKTGIAMRTLYIDPVAAQSLPPVCCVVKVSALLQQLILRVMDAPENYPADGPEARLMAVIQDELGALEPEPMYLPRPRDNRLLRITRALLDDPSDNRSLKTWSDTAGASERNLARLFVAETGMTFGEWREQLRLMSAISRLVVGEPVTVVAYDLGYLSPSAFIAMFKRNMGDTPARFARARQG